VVSIGATGFLITGASAYVHHNLIWFLDASEVRPGVCQSVCHGTQYGQYGDFFVWAMYLSIRVTLESSTSVWLFYLAQGHSIWVWLFARPRGWMRQCVYGYTGSLVNQDRAVW
jgi:hypothetical protein